MKQTTFFKLRKPEGKDVVNIDDFNYNFDEIDAALNDAANKAGDMSEGKVFTEQAATRTVPASGDTLAVIVGKVMRFFNDMKDAAYCRVANNSTTTASGYVADARALKSVADKVTALETSFPAGCKKIAKAITGGRDGNGTGGVATAENASPDTMSTNIKSLAINNYNSGITDTKKGNAAVADVISGKTFTSEEAGVNKTGQLADFRGNTRTITPTANGGTKSGNVLDGTGSWTEELEIAEGAHNKIIVSKAEVYRKGATDADARVNTNSANYKGGYSAGKTDQLNAIRYVNKSGHANVQFNAPDTVWTFSLSEIDSTARKILAVGFLSCPWSPNSYSLSASYTDTTVTVRMGYTYGEDVAWNLRIWWTR